MQLQHFCSTKKFKNIWYFSKSLSKFSRALHPCMTTNHNFWPLFPLGKEEVGTVVDWQTICWGISACRPPCRRNTIYFPLKVSFNIKRFFCCASSSRLYPRRPSENEKGGGDLPRQMSVLRFQLFKLICPPVPETSCPRSWEVKLPAAIT